MEAQKQLLINYNHRSRNLSLTFLERAFNKNARDFEESRFGWMSFLLTVETCIGSIACMYILMNNASNAVFISCIAITMMANSILIAQGPAKLCLALSYSSILLNILFIIMNFSV